MTQFYSRNDTTFQGDSIFTIPFSYIKQEDINIFVNDELIKDWLWLNETQVSITKELTLGDLISIRRRTPIDGKIVDYQNMSMVLDDNNLNLSQDQNIYSIQELYDSNEQFKINTNETLTSDKVELENIIETNRQELLDIQTNFENETNIKFDDYKTELNTKIETVAEAADKINELEEAVGIATEAASVAINKAEEAANIADTADKNMQAKLEEATTLIDNKITSNDVTMQEVLTQAEEILSETESVLEETKDTLSNTLTKSQITNCITKIPQRIKADVVDGTLTVYAGSVAIVPYGTTDRTSEFPVGSTFIHENFKVVDTQFADNKFFVWVEVQSDISGTPATTDSKTRWIILYVNASTLDGAISSGSGTSPSGNLLYYNTNTNLVEYLNSGANTDGNLAALPLGISQADGTNKFASITQTFNGMGYIGSTYWIDKGYKGLISIGRNADRTLKNIEWNNEKLELCTFASTVSYEATHMAWAEEEGGRLGYMFINSTNWVYDEENNTWHWKGGSARSWLDLGTCTTTAGVISNFNPKQPFRAVDYSDYSNDIDGKWTKVTTTIFSNKTFAKGASTTYNCKDILPNDGNLYECIFKSFWSCGGKIAGAYVQGVTWGSFGKTLWYQDTSTIALLQGNGTYTFGNMSSSEVQITGCSLILLAYRKVR